MTTPKKKRPGSKKATSSTVLVPKGRLRSICDDLKTQRSGLGRAEQTAAAKALFDAAYLAAQRGRPTPKRATVARFVNFMKAHTGLETRILRYDLQIVENIDEEIRGSIRGTAIANRTKDLIALSAMKDRDLQLKGIHLLSEGKTEEFIGLLPLTTSKKLPQSATSVAIDLVLGGTGEARIGTTTVAVEVVTIEGKHVKVIISKTSPRAITPTPSDVAGNGQDLGRQVVNDGDSETTEAPGVLPSSTGDLDVSWESVLTAPTRPMTAAEMLAIGIKNPDEGTRPDLIVLPEHLDVTALVIGPFADFARDATQKPMAAVLEIADEAGLVSLAEHPEPGATLVVLFGKRNSRVRLVGIGRCDNQGELPNDVIVSLPGNKVCKVRLHGSTLGDPRTWIANPSTTSNAA